MIRRLTNRLIDTVHDNDWLEVVTDRFSGPGEQSVCMVFVYVCAPSVRTIIFQTSLRILLCGSSLPYMSFEDQGRRSKFMVTGRKNAPFLSVDVLRKLSREACCCSSSSSLTTKMVGATSSEGFLVAYYAYVHRCT